MAILLNKLLHKNYTLKVYNSNDSVCFEKSFRSIISALLCAYGHDSFILITSHDFYTFKMSDFNCNDTDCLYNQFFLGYISLLLTRSQRDKFIKKLRG